ncbi:MAG: extracellular solute-binding protein [Chloroflexota bacterium]|nr:extracellular solute-binding protein [Chloroflexota bacterium]
MQSRKRHHYLITLLALTLLMAVGQGGVATVAQDEAQVSIWFDTTGGAETANCIIEQAVDTFNEQSDTIEVTGTLQANSWDATRTSLAGGGGPDIVTTPGPSFAFELANAQQLLPLDDFAAEYGWAETFTPWALRLGEVQGQLYSLPTEVETLVLYYNATLFEEQGWDAPTTLDELMALAEEIDAAGIIPFAHTNAEWRPSNEWFVGEFLNHGAGPEKVYQALTGEIEWTDPEFVSAIEMLSEMQQNGWFMGGLDRYYTTATATAFAMLAEGEAAMKIEGTWAVTDLNSTFGEEGGNTNEWDWVPMPSASGEAIFDLGIGSTFSINQNTQVPEAAVEFLSHLFSPEIQAALAVECDMVPAPVELEENALEGLDPRYAEILDAMNEASEAGDYGYTTWTFWPPRSDVYIYEAIEEVWAGDLTAEEYLQGLQAIFDEELEAGDIPPIPER